MSGKREARDDSNPAPLQRARAEPIGGQPLHRGPLEQACEVAIAQFLVAEKNHLRSAGFARAEQKISKHSRTAARVGKSAKDFKATRESKHRIANITRWNWCMAVTTWMQKNQITVRYAPPTDSTRPPPPISRVRQSPPFQQADSLSEGMRSDIFTAWAASVLEDDPLILELSCQKGSPVHQHRPVLTKLHLDLMYRPPMIQPRLVWYVFICRECGLYGPLEIPGFSVPLSWFRWVDGLNVTTWHMLYQPASEWFGLPVDIKKRIARFVRDDDA